jgi:hypothetical protein
VIRDSHDSAGQPNGFLSKINFFSGMEKKILCSAPQKRSRIEQDKSGFFFCYILLDLHCLASRLKTNFPPRHARPNNALLALSLTTSLEKSFAYFFVYFRWGKEESQHSGQVHVDESMEL